MCTGFVRGSDGVKRDLGVSTGFVRGSDGLGEI